jgi:hypothetical protein
MIGKQILLSFSWEKNILTEEGSEKNVHPRQEWDPDLDFIDGYLFNYTEYYLEHWLNK